MFPAGGGFTAPYDEATARLFYQTAGVINGALERFFPEGCGVRIIAEPGRLVYGACAGSGTGARIQHARMPSMLGWVA
jgi:diaminopimelate decarboxylase